MFHVLTILLSRCAGILTGVVGGGVCVCADRPRQRGRLCLRGLLRIYFLLTSAQHFTRLTCCDCGHDPACIIPQEKLLSVVSDLLCE